MHPRVWIPWQSYEKKLCESCVKLHAASGGTPTPNAPPRSVTVAHAKSEGGGAEENAFEAIIVPRHKIARERQKSYDMPVATDGRHEAIAIGRGRRRAAWQAGQGCAGSASGRCGAARQAQTGVAHVNILNPIRDTGAKIRRKG